MQNVLKRLADYQETDDIVEESCIPGLFWKRNDFYKTTAHSRIILPSPGQSLFTVVFHAEDFSDSSHGGYEFYGCHLGQDDVLTFLAHDEREMTGHFVDCRKGSPTLHQSLSLSFKGNSDRSLVIGRGIAHIFDNLMGMTTINQMRMHFDFRNPDFIPGSDVINIKRGTPIAEFPALRVNRFRSPRWLCHLMVKQQRIAIRRSGANYPFQFKHGGKNFAFFPKG
jgi:dTDP-4-dehydrorhamnose 3,5-epimerase